MRGTLDQLVLVGARIGIIPAYAGNTEGTTAVTGKNLDHPRVCGEHIASRKFPVYAPGSSPRMRGTHIGTDGVAYLSGIIPAYAGNT